MPHKQLCRGRNCGFLLIAFHLGTTANQGGMNETSQIIRFKVHCPPKSWLSIWSNAFAKQIRIAPGHASPGQPWNNNIIILPVRLVGGPTVKTKSPPAKVPTNPSCRHPKSAVQTSGALSLDRLEPCSWRLGLDGWTSDQSNLTLPLIFDVENDLQQCQQQQFNPSYLKPSLRTQSFNGD